MFAVGDKVICTDAASWGPGTIVIGSEYTISVTLFLHAIESVKLAELDQSFSFYAHRFTAVPPEKAPVEVDFFSINRMFA